MLDRKFRFTEPATAAVSAAAAPPAATATIRAVEVAEISIEPARIVASWVKASVVVLRLSSVTEPPMPMWFPKATPPPPR